MTGSHPSSQVSPPKQWTCSSIGKIKRHSAQGTSFLCTFPQCGSYHSLHLLPIFSLHQAGPQIIPFTQGLSQSAPNPPLQFSFSFFPSCFLCSSHPAPLPPVHATQLFLSVLHVAFAQVVSCAENVHLPTQIPPILLLAPGQRLSPSHPPKRPHPAFLSLWAIALALGVPSMPSAPIVSGHREGHTEHLQTHVPLHAASPYQEHSAWHREYAHRASCRWKWLPKQRYA